MSRDSVETERRVSGVMMIEPRLATLTDERRDGFDHEHRRRHRHGLVGLLPVRSPGIRDSVDSPGF